ncbi:hypothetical protein A1L58_18770 [Shewanella baltica]|nr:hypothetical protein A1L58_18770 [Shewanella baltica]
MVICETTVRPMDGAVEHPRMDWLRVGERMPWLTYTLIPANAKIPTTEITDDSVELINACLTH